MAFLPFNANLCHFMSFCAILYHFIPPGMAKKKYLTPKNNPAFKAHKSKNAGVQHIYFSLNLTAVVKAMLGYSAHDLTQWAPLGPDHCLQAASERPADSDDGFMRRLRRTFSGVRIVRDHPDLGDSSRLCPGEVLSWPGEMFGPKRCSRPPPARPFCLTRPRCAGSSRRALSWPDADDSWLVLVARCTPATHGEVGS